MERLTRYSACRRSPPAPGSSSPLKSRAMAEIPEVATIPPGFRLIERLSPFNALVGPLYEKREAEPVSIGLAIEEKHTNSRGVCPGGLRATLAHPRTGSPMRRRSG